MFPDWAWDFSTPTLLYLMDPLRRSASEFVRLCDKFDITCCYSVKANRQPKVLAAVSESGLGFDVASFEELQVVKELDAPLIVATGPGLGTETMVTVDEMDGIVFFDNQAQINVAQEVDINVNDHGVRLAINGHYSALGFAANEIEKLHATGFPINKIHVHGGEYLDQHGVERRLQFIRSIVGKTTLEVIDFGGGYGVLSNNPDCLREALGMMRSFGDEMSARIVLEPGKSIVARCGILVTTILASKERSEGQVLVVDCSSYNLGLMEVRALSKFSGPPGVSGPTKVIGPTCYEGDVWGRFQLPRLAPGDRLIFSNMGAYTMSIAASLHGLPAPKELFIEQ